MANVVITGAARGIGLELCRQMSIRGDSVVAVCRKPSLDLEALDVSIEENIDVADEASIQRLTRPLANFRIDILINNAGILESTELDDLDFASIQRQIDVNACGPLRVTQALLPMMRKGSKVAIVTSRMGSMGDNTSGGYYGYRMSKAAVNAAGVSLAQDLKPKGVAVALLHPGMVRTDMTASMGDNSLGIEPEASARALLTRIDALTLETTGRFQHAVTGEILPW